jgi:hypothetical protein
MTPPKTRKLSACWKRASVRGAVEVSSRATAEKGT